jgi:hypothetical protein
MHGAMQSAVLRVAQFMLAAPHDFARNRRDSGAA